MPFEIVDEYRESAFAQRQTGRCSTCRFPPSEREQPPEASVCA